MRIQVLATHPDAFVTVRELAAYWLVSPRQIYKHICNGALPAVNVGGRAFRISTKAAAEFERRMKVQPFTDGSGRPRGTRRVSTFALIRGNDAAAGRPPKPEDGGGPRPVAGEATELPESD